MWDAFENYRVDTSKKVRDASCNWDYITKHEDSYHVEMLLFSLVTKNKDSKPYGQAYYAEIKKDSKPDIQIKKFIFPDRMVKITESGTDKEIRDRMSEYVILQTKIKLEEGWDNEESIEISDNITLLGEEIERLKGVLKNAKEKRIGFR